MEKEKKVLKKSLPMLQVAKQEKGKIITDENKEESNISFKVYKRYQQLSGGWIAFTVIIILMIIFTLLKLLADYWVGAWAKSLSNGKD